MKTEIISPKLIENYAKRLEKTNLKNLGRSCSFVTIARASNKYIICIHDYGCEIKKGWREAMKQLAIRPI